MASISSSDATSCDRPYCSRGAQPGAPPWHHPKPPATVHERCSDASRALGVGSSPRRVLAEFATQTVLVGPRCDKLMCKPCPLTHVSRSLFAPRGW